MREHKARLGSPYRFIWRAMAPTDPEAGEGDRPSLVLRYAAGPAAAIELTPLVASAVSIVAASERTLTAAAPVEAPGAIGTYGAAWLLGGEDGPMPVRVVRVTGSTIHLADAPPRPLLEDLDATLVWATWYCTVPSPAAAERSVPLTVSYTRMLPGPLTDAAAIEEGIIHWVPVPWSSGLDHEGLARLRPELASAVADREQDLASVIEDSEDELVTVLRAILVGRGLTEDDIVARPVGMRLVHANLACAHFFAGDARAEAFRSQALGILDEATGQRLGGDLDQVMKGVFFDPEHDGGGGGAPQQVTGPRTSDAGGSFSTATVDVQRRHQLGGRTFIAGGPR